MTANNPAVAILTDILLTQHVFGTTVQFHSANLFTPKEKIKVAAFFLHQDLRKNSYLFQIQTTRLKTLCTREPTFLDGAVV